MNAKALKLLVFLFLLNFLSLYVYFSAHPDHRSSPSTTQHAPHNPTPHIASSLKPWPILPSYLPWDQNRDVSFRSCEAYFGNGFTERFDALKSVTDPHRKVSASVGSSGWFRCFYSSTLRSSICEGGRIRMIPERIGMSKGGEKLENVIGRREGEEMPDFEDGAFEIEVGDKSKIGQKLVDDKLLNKIASRGTIEKHTMRSLLDSIRLVDASEFLCSEWIEEPTVLVTRFEYANLFHTITDWYSAYVASRVTGLPNRPRVVFVDGHCQTQLEETWTAMFSSITYAKNFSGPVCFRHAILAPLGYETALFKGLSESINCHGASAHDLWQKPDNSKTARISEFGEMIRAAFGFAVDRHVPKPASGRNVLFVRREDYQAHPRHGGKVQSRLSNEQEVYDSIKKWASSNPVECKVNVVNGLFGHMALKEQVQAIQDADVIVGAHGAGLTHIVSATPNTVILEIISSEYMRPHFQLIATWKGLEYHAINLRGSYAEPGEVIDKLRNILRSLGC